MQNNSYKYLTFKNSSKNNTFKNLEIIGKKRSTPKYTGWLNCCVIFKYKYYKLNSVTQVSSIILLLFVLEIKFNIDKSLK